jgi:hypothetical protein
MADTAPSIDPRQWYITLLERFGYPTIVTFVLGYGVYAGLAEREQSIREEARDVFLAHRVAGMRFFQARAAMMRDMTNKYGNDIDWVEILAALLKVLLILVPLFTEEGT